MSLLHAPECPDGFSLAQSDGDRLHELGLTAADGVSRKVSGGSRWRMLEAMRSASASWCALYRTTHDMGSMGIRFHNCASMAPHIERLSAGCYGGCKVCLWLRAGSIFTRAMFALTP